MAGPTGIGMRGTPSRLCTNPASLNTTRASFCLCNTNEEIDILVASLRKILKFFTA